MPGVDRSGTFRFGDLLVRLGHVSPSELQELLSLQERLRPPLGGYFLERGLCTEAQIEEIIAWQRRWSGSRAAAFR